MEKYASRKLESANQMFSTVIGTIGAGFSLGEYDRYVGDFAVIIRRGETDEDLIRYLEWAEAVHMGLGRFDLSRARTVFAALRALGWAP